MSYPFTCLVLDIRYERAAVAVRMRKTTTLSAGVARATVVGTQVLDTTTRGIPYVSSCVAEGPTLSSVGAVAVSIPIKTIDPWDILNQGLTAIELAGAWRRDIPNMTHSILVKASGEAMKAEVWGKVAVVEFVEHIDLQLQSSNSIRVICVLDSLRKPEYIFIMGPYW
jgi:hypothetical protein